MESTSNWFTSPQILPEHSSLQIKQVYLWFISADHFLAIVGRGNKFQFPGGKPELAETPFEALQREVYEEAGIIIDTHQREPKLFGYYLVENDFSNGQNGSPYLQLRFWLQLQESSESIHLTVNERADDIHQMETAQLVELSQLPDYIPWTADLEEYSAVMLLVR